MDAWSRKFRWYFIKWAYRKIKYLDNADDVALAQKCFSDLRACGALDTPPYGWARKIRCGIDEFIKCGCIKK